MRTVICGIFTTKELAENFISYNKNKLYTTFEIKEEVIIDC